MECLGAPLGQPAIVRTRDRTVRILQEAQILRERGVVCGEDRGAHDHV